MLLAALNDVERYEAFNKITSKAVKLAKRPSGFRIELGDGSVKTCQTLIIATGTSLKEEFFNIDGIREVWGQSLFTCPYCHGFEFTGKKIAILHSSEHDNNFVRIMSQWSEQINYFGNGASVDENVSAFLKPLNPRNEVLF